MANKKLLKHINLCVRKFDREYNLYTYAFIEVNAKDFEKAKSMVEKACRILRIAKKDIEITLDMNRLPQYRIEPITEIDEWRGCYKVEDIPNKLNYEWASGYDDPNDTIPCFDDDDYDD